MKLAHNIRFTSFSRSPEAREEVLSALETWLDMPLKKYAEKEDLSQSGFDTLYNLKIWLDTQPLVRGALRALRSLPKEDIDALLSQKELHLDEHLTFSLRIDKQSLLEQKPRFTLTGDVVQVRINPAAYPKTGEKALSCIEGIFGSATKV